MGNPKFAINPLKSLLASNHDIVAVISNPPKPMGRKKILKHTVGHILTRVPDLGAFQPVPGRIIHEESEFAVGNA